MTDDLWNSISEHLERGEGVVAATVVSHSGSTPRTSGSRMIVRPDGRISGTVGGGALEGDVIRAARHAYETRRGALRFYDLNETTSTDDLDLVCGGRMHVLLEFVAPDERNIEVYRALAGRGQGSGTVLFIGRLEGGDEDLSVERAVLTGDGRWVGWKPGSPGLRAALADRESPRGQAALFDVQGGRYVIETLLPAETLYIVGAGHVSLEVARLAHRTGFGTVVIDDRPEFASAERFPEADTVLVRPEFLNVFDDPEPGPDSSIVIVTRGHRYDKRVLGQALGTRAGYIGMIGSARKRDTIYRALMNEGTDAAELERVRCPVGLDIEAETPAEIAVSITAELIRHRAAARARR